jgi:hydrogenase maturation protein HypF
MIQTGIHSPSTSSCGRLFDAVSFLTGLAPPDVEFEAEAPMRLEAVSGRRPRTGYPFELAGDDFPWFLSFAPAIRGIVRDLRDGAGADTVGSRFHLTLARAIAAVAKRARDLLAIDTVALVGGVFLNRILIERTEEILNREGFRVLRPEKYSPNDESISVGQVAYALNMLRKQ